jgi:hypothetical protein
MQTLNFQCGHCGNLMAVGVAHLGQQVRCPHCQQVVLAPSPTPPAVPEPSPPVPTPVPAPPETPFQQFAAQEDIFSSPPPSDDLFGRPEAPRLEIPSEPLPAPAPAPAVSTNGEPAAADVTPPGPAAFTPFADAPSPPDAAAADQPVAPVVPAAADWMSPPADAPAPETVAMPDSVRGLRKAPAGGGWFIPLVFIPVVIYAVIVTVALVYVLTTWRTPPAPKWFEEMPDFGDNPGVRKPKSTTLKGVSLRDVTAPLPVNLHVPLGGGITIGELRVLPLRVERKKVAVFVKSTNRPAEPCAHDSLVLHLELRNVSSDHVFTPLDNYFDRWWKEGQGPPPFTLLEAGDVRYFGGPAKWVPLGAGLAKGDRQWVQGRKDSDPVGLKPGQTMRTFICTDGDDAAAARHLFGVDATGKRVGTPYHGPLLWRVHVRRGLINYLGRQVSATAVIGVEFTDQDYLRKGVGRRRRAAVNLTQIRSKWANGPLPGARPCLYCSLPFLVFFDTVCPPGEPPRRGAG